MNTRHALDVIEVRSPCTANWNQMSGDRQTRFCQHCQKHVHNLSAMAADEAERLVCQNAGKLCVRFERDAAGRVITLDYGGSTRPRWSWRVWTLVALAAALITGSVQAVLFGTRIKPVGPTVVAGNLAPIMRVPPGSSGVWQGEVVSPIDDSSGMTAQPTTQPAQ
jgi:hypothetical protein